MAQVATTSDTQAAQLTSSLYRAGLRGSALVRGVAIGILEGGSSSSTANVPNPAPGNLPEYSVGPWQINLLAHGNQISEAEARNPDSAAVFVVGLYQAAGGTFAHDWTNADAALNGQGSPELLARAQVAQQRATAAVASLGLAQGTQPNTRTISTGGSGAPIIGGLLDAGSAASQLAANLLSRAFWARIGLTAGAIALMVIGLLLYFRRDVEQAAGVAARAGAAA